MGNLTSQLTRTCSVCGIEKPLSAFLQLSSTHGTSYGTVCAQCRSLGKTKNSPPKATDDERSTTPSGMGIRGKEKLYIDAKRDQKIHTLKELYKKEKLKKEGIVDDKNKRDDLKEISEKKFRDFYLDKKQAFERERKAKANAQTATREENQKTVRNQTAAEQHRTIQETKTKELTETKKIIETEEIKKTSTDFNNITEALHTGRSEMQSAQLGNYFKWLGDASPVVQFLKQRLGTSANPNKSRQTVTTEGKNTPREPTRRNR